MCDQDHFEDDLHEYEKRGLITRRQFGVLVGAGACMVLPQVANAVAVSVPPIAAAANMLRREIGLSVTVMTRSPKLPLLPI